MPKFERFAASFLSLALLAAPGAAADLRAVKDPKQIDKIFPAAAKLRVVNIWATWCAPCVAEMPDLRSMHETLGKEVAFGGVSMDDMVPGTKQDKVVRFLDKQGIRFPNVYFTGLPDALGEHFDFRGELPITLIFDQKGKELWRHQGRLDKKETLAKIRELLRRNR